MFGSSEADGLGFQLSMYRLVDEMRDNGDRVRESTIRELEWQEARAEYARLLAKSQNVERALQERNQQLVALQNELALRNQQLEATKQELTAVYERNAFEAEMRRLDMISIQDRARARRNERDAGSQPT